MIACLQGELFHKSPEALIVNVNGVGYEVFFPQSRHNRLPDVGEEVFLYIHTAVREDAFQLYGFLEPAEKEMFLSLVGVSGVGPKLAMNILAGIHPKELGQAIVSKDIGRLTLLPGIGKKTAERLCLELKDKVCFLSEVMPVSTHEGTDTPDDQRFHDAFSVLINLGYSPAQAKDSLKKVSREVPEEDFAVLGLEDLLRNALRLLT